MSKWLYGKHACIAALQNKKRTIHKVLVTEQFYIHNKHLFLLHKKYELKITDKKTLQTLLPNNAAHQGIAVQVSALLQYSLPELLHSYTENSTILVLDNITDAHNVGAIVRTAVAFTVKAIIVPRHNSLHDTSVLAKTSSGMIEVMPIVTVTNLITTLKLLKDHGYWCYGMTTASETSLQSMVMYDKSAIILGAENKGIRKLVIENCDCLVKIPISSRVASLNVSNAAAIVLYDLWCKKHGGK